MREKQRKEQLAVIDKISLENVRGGMPSDPIPWLPNPGPENPNPTPWIVLSVAVR
jgi:hypothetical protein